MRYRICVSQIERVKSGKGSERRAWCFAFRLACCLRWTTWDDSTWEKLHYYCRAFFFVFLVFPVFSSSFIPGRRMHIPISTSMLATAFLS